MSKNIFTEVPVRPDQERATLFPCQMMDEREGRVVPFYYSLYELSTHHTVIIINTHITHSPIPSMSAGQTAELTDCCLTERRVC